MGRGTSCVIFVIALASCNRRPHVTLTAPAASASAPDRLAAFQALRPVDGQVVTTTSCSGRGGCTSSIRSSVTLANGTEVHHAEDLAPVVTASSPSGTAIARMYARRDRASMWGKIAAAGILGGLGGGLLLAEVGAGDTVALGTVGVGLTVFLVGMVGRQWNKREAAYAQIEAFEQFDASLAMRLGLCVQGLAVVACEQAGATPTPRELRTDDPALRSLRQR